MIDIKMFPKLEIETSSSCNRFCSMCLRNRYPNRIKIESWFKQNLLADEIVYDLIDQAEKMLFKGELGLSHYNEPLLDERLVRFGEYARQKNNFKKISFCTNGDLLDEEKIKQIDGVFDEIVISKKENDFKLKDMFKKTNILFTNKHYIVKHFDPNETLLQQAIQKVIKQPCMMGYQGMYINHLGDMLMCCSDLIGHFNLGNVKEHTLQELWYSEKHQNLLQSLACRNSRQQYPHCSICPLPTIFK